MPLPLNVRVTHDEGLELARWIGRKGEIVSGKYDAETGSLRVVFAAFDEMPLGDIGNPDELQKRRSQFRARESSQRQCAKCGEMFFETTRPWPLYPSCVECNASALWQQRVALLREALALHHSMVLGGEKESAASEACYKIAMESSR